MRNKSKEVWRPISRYNNEVECSNLGNFRRLVSSYTSKRGAIIPCQKGPIIPSLSGGCKDNRYLALYSHGEPTTFAHILIAETWLGDIPAGYHVCHCNNDRRDNRVENLRIDTASANQYERGANGGGNFRTRVITAETAEEIKKGIEAKISGVDLAKRFGVSEPLISRIKTGHLWNNGEMQKRDESSASRTEKYNKLAEIARAKEASREAARAAKRALTRPQLTPLEAAEMIVLRNSGWTISAISDRFKRSRSCVELALKRGRKA
jgi:hypothetical protein